jgi:hypothetical protein
MKPVNKPNPFAKGKMPFGKAPKEGSKKEEAIDRKEVKAAAKKKKK